jgi:hypothetical protein
MGGVREENFGSTRAKPLLQGVLKSETREETDDASAEEDVDQ